MSAPPPILGVRVEVPLSEGLNAARDARAGTRAFLMRWKLRRLVEPVLVVVSELVTNAVRHGRPPVRLFLTRRPGDIGLAVHDANPAEPVQRDADSHRESGRGMGIVHSLSDEVRVEQVPDDGKIVHATFSTQTDGI